MNMLQKGCPVHRTEDISAPLTSSNVPGEVDGIHSARSGGPEMKTIPILAYVPPARFTQEESRRGDNVRPRRRHRVSEYFQKIRDRAERARRIQP